MTETHADLARYDNATVLVTGGAGFIGSHLVRRLQELGASVRVIDDLSTGFAHNLPTGVDFTEASFLDRDALRGAARGCDVIFHLGAIVSVVQSVEDPAHCAEVNITGTQAVLDAALEAKVRRVVLAASAAAYGDEPSLPSCEHHPPDSRSPYAASKVAGEQLLRAFGACYELSTVSVRYFNIFGPRQDPKSPYAAVISAFADALQNGRSPVIHGDGGQTRDFTAVANAVHATTLAGATSVPLAGEIINVGTGRRTSVLEVVNQMAAILGVDANPTFSESRAGDVRDSVADISRARELLGYEPLVSLEDGLRALLAATAATE